MVIRDILQNKVIIVAGGCGLLGAAFARAIGDNKGSCIIADRNEPEGMRLVEEITTRDSAVDIHYESIDLCDRDSVAAVIETVHGRYGKIDGFVNAAYPRNQNWGKSFFEDVEMDDFLENVNLHLGGYFLPSQMICKYFKKQGHGNIIQIASILGVRAPKFDTYKGASFNGNDMNCPVEYSILKAGIIHFSRYIAAYYKGCNIRSNCISPGGLLAGQGETFLSKYKNCCLSKGMLDPEDLTGTLIFLLSDMSAYVNGQNIVVDDGWSL
jgi:NAD(P)-dependent dehydrogenase (short-subunit alcohol dehydrogenase family)